jgi:dolichol-phosphate mannosyltransferase
MRTLVIVPTYDERESLPGLLDRLHAAAPGVEVLVVDDASPDGTGDLAEARAADEDRLHVLHRAGKEGLGAAYVAGFAWGLQRGYDVLCEMDADGSHRPEELRRLLDRLAAADEPALVIGSRWVPGGRVVNWPWHRLLLSRAGNAYVRLALGIGVRDATGGYRAFRADVLRAVDLSAVESHGYCFQVDMTWRVLRNGGAVAEVPITFVERVAGESKMSRAIVVEALTKVTRWGLRHRWAQLRGLRPGR